MISTRARGNHLDVLLTARAINPLSRLFQRELAALLDQLEARRPRPASVVVAFSNEAGANAHELEHLMTLTPAQAGDCMQMLGTYNALLRQLELLGLPVTAVLDGEVSGHALGLALACHRRVAAADARLRLPQVQFGLAPVAGAIARSVRLTGPVAALPLLLDGAVFTAGRAQQAGLVHTVAADAAALARLADYVQDNIPCRQPWDGRDGRIPGGGLEAPAVRALLQQAATVLRERGTPAAEAILCAMVEGLQVDFDNALLIESRYFCQTALHRDFSTDLKRFL